MAILFIFSFLAGMFTMLSPCILPILPIVLAAGVSQGRWRPLGVSIGLIISFSFFTLTLTSIVQTLGVSADALRLIAIGFVFVFGLFMTIPYLSERLDKLLAPVAKIGQKIKEKGPKEGLLGGIILGCALGLLWTPCAGPILAAISAFIATQSVTHVTVGLALTYVIGAAIPLFFVSWGGARLLQASQLSRHTELLRRFFGIVTMFVAAALYLHWDIVIEQKIARVVPVVLIEDNQLVHEELGKLQKDTGGTLSEALTSYGKAPELMGVTNWINSPPLFLQELRGKVVLIDFWTYSCINCLRTLPYLKDWYAKYKDDGLVIIGVHTPEFEFEKRPANVVEAVSHLGIEYPVAQDNTYSVWKAYHNSFWPAHYLIDQKGNIVLVHYGEGGYAEMERAIQKLLGKSENITEEPIVSHRSISPETYLGTRRGGSYTAENKIRFNQPALYSYASPLRLNEVGLKGLWLAQEESITAEGDDSYLDFHFLAKQVYLVLSGSSPHPLEVFVDGQPLQKITVDGDRKYDIVTTAYGQHILSLKVPKGVSAYVFTFGDE